MLYFLCKKRAKIKKKSESLFSTFCTSLKRSSQSHKTTTKRSARRHTVRQICEYAMARFPCGRINPRMGGNSACSLSISSSVRCTNSARGASL